ncbi:uncharacterized protein LOC111489641 isoform X2 [Cucurbita maxima]|uniref:Uncharacterized protein LOC111489641 isoform X2 n=1 Tax=Cucurbita maxima TaxID=3661 RepID=A0A6J1K0X6_CUCMA|nr:uncharacterized protein LOC111489641 isoform X2 [Cucurbita maxima]
MKQKVAQRKALFQWRRKLVFVFLLVFCFGSLVMMQSRYGRVMMLASLHPQSAQGPKIAFLFIARNRLPLDIVWDAFFQEGENKFSIFVHSRPGFLFNKATTRSIYFLNRQVNDSIQVDWGKASMVEAERILLRHALTDTSNQRFIFLSDSCIPLYNFNYTYDYVMSTSTSFVDSFADTKEGRYNPKMDPVIPVQNWRKGSQWVVLTRKHAKVVVKDITVFPMFEQHCKASHLVEFFYIGSHYQSFGVIVHFPRMDPRNTIVFLMNIMFKLYWPKKGLKKSSHEDHFHIQHGISRIPKTTNVVIGIL